MNQHIKLLLTKLMPQDVAKLRNLFVLLWDIDDDSPQEFAIRFRNLMISHRMVWEGMTVGNLCAKWVMVILKYEDCLVPIRLSLTDLYFWAFFTSNGWHKFANCPLDFEESVQCTELRFGGSYSSLDYVDTIRFGWSTLRDMIHVVSTHTGDPSNIKKLLLQPLLFVCEAVRFHVVSDLLTESYNSTCVLNESTWKWINNWSKMSEAIITLKFHGRIMNLNIGNIEDVEDVLATIKADDAIKENLDPFINLVEEAYNEEGGAGIGVGVGLSGRGAQGVAPINPRGAHGSPSAGAGGYFFSGHNGGEIEQVPSERSNRKLMQVFSVLVCEEFWVKEGQKIYGAVLLKPSHGQCNALLFKRSSRDLPIINKVGFIKLSGPTGGVEVNDEVAFHSYLWTLMIPTFNVEYSNTLWTDGVDATNQLICKQLSTMYGPLEVNFAVYNNAVEAHLEVVLLNWEMHDEIEVFGTVYSGSSIIPKIQARSTLFDRSIDDAVHVKLDNDGTKLPLSQSVTVVPLGSTLLVDVMIWRLKNSRRDHQPISEKLSFNAALTGTETKVASGKWGDAEVTVTWSG